MDILKYSKNGKSTEFLYECPICKSSFVGNASRTKPKLCDSCISENENKNIEVAKKNNQEIICQEVPKGIFGGVYVINVGKSHYIGETFNFVKRWNQHITDLKNGEHSNSRLQAAFNSEKSFEFKILESYKIRDFSIYPNYKSVLKIWNLLRENYFIKQYESNSRVLNIERTLNVLQNFVELKDYFDMLEDVELNDLEAFFKFGNTDSFIGWKELKSILLHRK